MAAPSLSSPARLLAELERSTGAAPSGPALEVSRALCSLALGAPWPDHDVSTAYARV